MPRFIAASARLLADRRGGVAMIFALALIPLVTGIGMAVDYASAHGAATRLQTAVDAAALAAIKTATDSGSATAIAQPIMQSNLANTAFANAVTMSATYDATTPAVTVTATTTISSVFHGLIGAGQVSITRAAKAAVSNAQRYQVCVMITDPDSIHTLRADNASGVNFNTCLVQVNTSNWDAVEADHSAYIHGVNGQNCFVGDIHFGDITPAKSPTCSFFADPFASYAAPSGASVCGQTNYVVTSRGATLSPGVYCNGLTINADATLSPGLYIVRDGALAIGGNASNIVAHGVTFYLTGNGAGLNIAMANPGVLDITPATAASAGAFANFLFYLDQSSVSSGGASGGPLGAFGAAAATGAAAASVLRNVTMNTSGIIYLAGQQLQVVGGSSVTLNTGAIVAGFLLPDGGSMVNVTGSIDSATTASSALIKTGYGKGAPFLVR